MTTGVGSTSSSSASSLGAPRATSTTGTTTFDSQSFMRLLIAQIQHQDPLQPMDATQMTQQLTQLTSVERLVSIDQQIGSLSIATASVANAQAADLVGREIEADTSHLVLPDASAAEGTFELSGQAQSITVEIRDGQGNVVRTLSLPGAPAGPVPVHWDGHDTGGNRCASGAYTISVHAVDDQGHEVPASTRLRGVVDAVTYEHGFPELTVDGVHVVLGDVRSISAAPAPVPSATTP